MSGGDAVIQAARSRLFRRRWRSPSVGESWAVMRDYFTGTDERRRVWKKRSLVFGPPLLVALAVGAWLVFGPPRKPDYRRDNLKKVFNYTLLTDQFNNLPVEERLRLIGLLVERMKSMSSGDSALMAAFAAGIAGQAREQLEKNAARLAIDVWDSYAARYADVPPDDRGAYLDHAFIEFTKMMETMGGRTRDISDEERLAEGHRQAERDKKEFTRGGAPPGRALGRLFMFMNDDMGSHASPSQRARGEVMMMDMIRRMRGPG
jgi:hypothetical protein